MKFNGNHPAIKSSNALVGLALAGLVSGCEYESNYRLYSGAARQPAEVAVLENTSPLAYVYRIDGAGVATNASSPWYGNPNFPYFRAEVLPGKHSVGVRCRYTAGDGKDYVGVQEQNITFVADASKTYEVRMWTSQTNDIVYYKHKPLIRESTTKWRAYLEEAKN